MNTIFYSTQLFYEYYEMWIKVYKEGAIKKVTLNKYYLTLRWIKRIVPDLKVCELNRLNYQNLLNEYALIHERQTTKDFHHLLKAAIKDAVYDQLILKDPTRKAVIKGKTPKDKKPKYLSHFELQALIKNLHLTNHISYDWLILLIAKTGMRFSEALAITPKDFDFNNNTITINKTWDYKNGTGFLPTKNTTSIRKIQIDTKTINQFKSLIKDLPENQAIFAKHKVYNSTINDLLERLCEKANIPIITIHSLRHTHASLLLYSGVSIASVAKRLGHSNITTTQKVYFHIVAELENKDKQILLETLSLI
ncbi:MAG: site-specific integrase [Malacoplasma sp.]|nr:site-specific integrase [Malacoplasma sp.]